jgi:hypothetical protein
MTPLSRGESASALLRGSVSTNEGRWSRNKSVTGGVSGERYAPRNVVSFADPACDRGINGPYALAGQLPLRARGELFPAASPQPSQKRFCVRVRADDSFETRS